MSRPHPEAEPTGNESASPDRLGSIRPVAIAAPIRTERLLLRPLLDTDLDDVWAYQALEVAIRYVPWQVRTREQSREHLAKRRVLTRLENDGDVLVLAIELPAAPDNRGRVIGDLTLVLKSTSDRQAEVGWILHPDFHGRGYAIEAATALLGLAFDELGSHRVAADLDPRNAPSARLCERLGMRREALLVDDRIFKGEFAGTAIYAMLEEEWRSRTASRDFPRPPR